MTPEPPTVSATAADAAATNDASLTRLRSEVRIDASPERVWVILADFGAIRVFHPGLRDSRSTSGAKSGVGATRHCDLRPMGSIEERIADWREGEWMEVEIYAGAGTPPLDFGATGARIALHPEGSGTRVTMDLRYRLRYGPLGTLIDGAVVRRQFGSGITLLLDGLKHYAERGESPTRATLARIATPAAPPA